MVFLFGVCNTNTLLNDLLTLLLTVFLVDKKNKQMAYPSPVLPRNSLSWENEKVSFFRRSQRLLHGGRGDNRPPPFLIPSSFPVFFCRAFFLSLPLSLFSRYFCLSAAFVYIGKFGNVCLVIFPLSVWFCLSFL